MVSVLTVSLFGCPSFFCKCSRIFTAVSSFRSQGRPPKIAGFPRFFLGFCSQPWKRGVPSLKTNSDPAGCVVRSVRSSVSGSQESLKTGKESQEIPLRAPQLRCWVSTTSPEEMFFFARKLMGVLFRECPQHEMCVSL